MLSPLTRLFPLCFAFILFGRTSARQTGRKMVQKALGGEKSFSEKEQFFGRQFRQAEKRFNAALMSDKNLFLDNIERLDTNDNIDEKFESVGVDESQATLPVLEPDAVSTLRLFAGFSEVAYCRRKNVETWSCGKECKKVDARVYSYFSTKRTGTVGYVASSENLNDVSEQHFNKRGASTDGPLFFQSSATMEEMSDEDAVHASLVITFRGSLTLKNIVTDLTFSPTPFQFHLPNASLSTSSSEFSLDPPVGAQIHLGFHQAFEDARQDVFRGIEQWRESELSEKLSKNDRRKKLVLDIFVTGHSLGGALSVLQALDLWHILYSDPYQLFPLSFLRQTNTIELLPRVSVYTYGSPRIGNHIFAEWVTYISSTKPSRKSIVTDEWSVSVSPRSWNLYRVTYFNDLITHLPPRINIYQPTEPVQVEKEGVETEGIKLPFFFRHTAQEFHIVSDKSRVIACDWSQTQTGIQGEDPACSAGYKTVNLLHHLTYFDVIFGPWC